LVVAAAPLLGWCCVGSDAGRTLPQRRYAGGAP